MNHESELPLTFYFSLVCDDEESTFQEASGLSKELSPEVGGEGENRFKHRVPTANSWQNVILKRGLVAADSKLISWIENTISDGLGTPIITKSIQIKLRNAEGKTIFSWTLHQAYPVKCSFADVRLQENEILLENLEFAYSWFDAAQLNPDL